VSARAWTACSWAAQAAAWASRFAGGVGADGDVVVFGRGRRLSACRARPISVAGVVPGLFGGG